MSVNEGLLPDNNAPVTSTRATTKDCEVKHRSSSPVRRFVSGVRSAITQANSDANGMGMLVEEASERATKPWYQRLPGDKPE